KLAVTFDALLKFDLADAKATMPEVISAIDSDAEQDTATVRFSFAGKVDVRTFREDASFIVDVSPMEGQRGEAAPRSDSLASAAAELSTWVKSPPPMSDAGPPARPAAPASTGA